MKCLGLMSGTSGDGVDCALVEIEEPHGRLQVKVLGAETVPYSRTLRSFLQAVHYPGRVDDVVRLHVVLGEVFAQAALRLLHRLELSREAVDVIGSHGHTVRHVTRPRRIPGIGLVRASFQVGDPAIIAERTGITTVADFRARDVAAGGEGAPLTPYIHHLLFQHPHRSRLIVNLGGIANVTYLPAAGRFQNIQAFDVGPCNLLLDALVRQATHGTRTMDRQGRLALQGQVHQPLINRLLRHAFFRKPPPKSTGREDFNDQFLSRVWQQAQQENLSVTDLLATSCGFIVQAIARSCKWVDGPVDEVIVGGGGVRNSMLFKQLTQVMAPAPVTSMDKHDSWSKAFESIAFAILAYQTIKGRCTNLPRVTGARHPVILGTIVPGQRFRCLVNSETSDGDLSTERVTSQRTPLT
ncbi:MAG: anhydro-N-acetylmuramic acid kinase [Nitrospirae bacterium]|nr:MAG: anhydro-N-acetylmuramic acid kinase [Nitrospirota bacterium]